MVALRSAPDPRRRPTQGPRKSISASWQNAETSRCSSSDPDSVSACMAPHALFLQRLAHALGDHSRIIVDGERHGTLESMRPRDEQAKPAIENVGGDPCFMW